MKLQPFIAVALAAALFYQCDPNKHIYKSEPYLGTIDTSGAAAYDAYDYGYDSDAVGDYDYDYSYDYQNDTAYSPYSNAIYRGSSKREFDLLHTKLDVSFDWSKAWMYGKATLTLKPYFHPMSTLTLDAKGFTVKEVSLVTATGRTPLKYVYNTDTIPDTLQMTIDLGKTFKKDESFMIYIDYIAKPNDLPLGGSVAITGDKGLYFINNDGADPNKPMQIWTQGETEATSCWCPTIDKPNERCTTDFSITVADKYQTLSNGSLISSKKNTDGTRTDNWKMDLPFAPYLFMMAVGEYAIVKDTWNKMQVNYYVEKDYEQDARAIFGNTPEMIDFYSKKLGVNYPWPKYSQIVVRDYVSGAMENASATLHGEFLQQHKRELLDENYEDVISHELFHHWFGDLVTCESWSNIPLNESFATYGEYLWREYKYGRDDADYIGYNDLQTYLNEASYKMVDLIRYNYDTREDMFDSHSYAKGGRVLHMLRKYLGDDAFFAGLNLYLEKNKFQSVEIHDLRKAMEEVSGEDLSWFFNEWFLDKGHAELSIYYEWFPEEDKLDITIYQNQDTSVAPVYVIPMDVDFYYNGKVERKRITLDRSMQTFSFNFPVQPDLVNVDAEKMLLGNKYDNKDIDSYIFQYQHAPLYRDRAESLEALAPYQAEDPRYRDLITSALDDKHWSLRQFAIDTLLIDASTPQSVKEKIMQMAKSDPRSYVRSSALNKLKEITGIDAWSVYNAAMNDSSYNVVATAMTLIYNNDKKKGLELARTYKTEANDNLSYSIMGILSDGGEAIDNDYFLAKFKEASGFEVYYVLMYYEPFILRMTDSYIIKKGVDELKKIASDQSSFWMSFTAVNTLSSMATTYQDAINNTTDLQMKQSLQSALDYVNAALTEVNGGGDY